MDKLHLGLRLIALWVAASPALLPAAAVPILSETNLTAQAWQSSLTNLAARTESDPAVNGQLLTIHTNALAPARSLADQLTTAAEFDQVITNAAKLLAAQRELPPLETEGTNEVSGLDAKQLEARLNQVEADLDAARKTLATFESEAKQRAARRTEIPKETAEAKTRLTEIELALKAKADANEPSAVTRANELFLLTRKAFREQQVATLERELRAYSATDDLLALQTEQAGARVKALTRRVDFVRGRLDAARKAESQAVADAARQQQAEALHPVLKELAATNTLHASELVTLNDSLQRANDDLRAMEKDLEALEQDFKNLATRVTANEAAGVKITDSIGVLLRRHRVDLARRSAVTNGIRARVALITDNQLREIDYKDRKSALGERESLIRETLALMGKSGVSQATEKVAGILKARVDLLNKLVAVHHELAETLGQVNTAEMRLHKTTAAFRHFVEERVLWIRSASPLGFSEDGARAFADEARSFGVLLNWRTWSAALEALLGGVAASPGAAALAGLLVFAAFAAQPTVRARLTEQGRVARQPTQVSLMPTLKGLGLTVAVALPGPLLLYATGDLLTAGYAPPPLATQLGSAFAVAALFYFTLGFYRHFLRANGLAVCHLGWPAECALKVRRHLTWFVAVAVPAAGFIVFAESRVSEGGEDRITFIGLMLVLASFLHLLFNPRRGPAFNPTNSRTGTTTRRLRYAAGVAMPVGLALTSALGYHLTAIEFSWRLANSIWLVLGITLASAVLVRWFYLERRQIALEKLRIKREAASTDDAEKAKALENELPEVSVTEVKEQTQSLLRTLVLISLIGGLWAIWSGVLPALNILDRHALWYVEQTVQPRTEKTDTLDIPALPMTALEKGDDESSTTKAKTIERAITLADLLLAAFVLIVTGIAARNLPGFLEISILKHLKLETGGGYAITTIVQYAVTIVGLVIACATIGLTWEKVQWLAAAVTLGIGFGLQEIFANFVAGIILLFERPVRVGDIITVDSTTGLVTRIRIRATTIRNWERQELIIPNKDLITGRLTNWTLSDTLNRLVVTVGVAYGTDTRKVRQILTEILRDHPHVLPDPASTVVFDQFADSSLNFTIRAFLSTLENRLETIHTLHEMINDRFAAADIEISFPQRDLHLRTVPSGFGESRPGA